MLSSSVSTWISPTTALTTATPEIILPQATQNTHGINPFVFPQSGFLVFEPSPTFGPAAADRLTPSLPFERAAEIYMSMRSIASAPGAIAARYVRKNTQQGYTQQARSLALFFHGMLLGEIDWRHMRAFQQARHSGQPPFIRKRRPHEEPKSCPVKPEQINQETQFLKRLKKLAGCWTDQDQLYFRELQEDLGDIRRALTPEEQGLWLDMARSKERWAPIHWYSIAAFGTTMSTNELRGLRLGDVNLRHRLIDIPWPAAKNKYRHRTITIDDADTLWAFERLLGRARDLGATDPQHYLFPARDTRKNCYVPEQHMSESGIKRLWEEVREVTGLKWFRLYDTRHTAITRMAEYGVPVQVIMAKAGHISPRMTQHYTHISLAAQRRWAPPQEARYQRPWTERAVRDRS